MDLPIVLPHKTAWLYHNVARPSEPLSRASSLYDEDSLANEAEPTASLPKLGLDAKGLRASTAVGIVADYLVSLGIPREELDHIDTLVNFDDARARRAMALFREIAQHRQVILFTCHERDCPAREQ